MKKIKVALTDDHHILLDGLKALLERQKDMTVCGAYTNGHELLQGLPQLQPDVVVADINMPHINGIDLTKNIKTLHPEINVLCLSMHDDSGHIQEMTEAGVSGYLLKNTNDAELLDAIRHIAAGKLYFPDDILARMDAEKERRQRLAESANEVKLTTREIEILRLIAKEYNNARIAETLYISERTVETHRKNMLRKTDHSTMLGLLKFAMEHKLL